MVYLSLFQSSIQAQGFSPTIIIQCDIVFMGKHGLLYDNWIYNVLSGNAFVLTSVFGQKQHNLPQR